MYIALHRVICYLPPFTNHPKIHRFFKMHSWGHYLHSCTRCLRKLRRMEYYSATATRGNFRWLWWMDDQRYRLHTLLSSRIAAWLLKALRTCRCPFNLCRGRITFCVHWYTLWCWNLWFEITRGTEIPKSSRRNCDFDVHEGRCETKDIQNNPRLFEITQNLLWHWWWYLFRITSHCTILSTTTRWITFIRGIFWSVQVVGPEFVFLTSRNSRSFITNKHLLCQFLHLVFESKEFARNSKATSDLCLDRSTLWYSQ